MPVETELPSDPEEVRMLESSADLARGRKGRRPPIIAPAL